MACGPAIPTVVELCEATVDRLKRRVGRVMPVWITSSCLVLVEMRSRIWRHESVFPSRMGFAIHNLIAPRALQCSRR